MQTILSSWLMLCFSLLGFGNQTPPAVHTHHVIKHQISRSPAAPVPSPATTPPMQTPPHQAAPVHTPVATTSPAPSPTPQPSPVPPTATAGSEIATDATCPRQSDVANTIQALTCLTSNARAYHGLARVSDNPALLAAASSKDEDMQACGYGHTACGRDFSYWITAKGYPGRCYGENIAMGQTTPHDVFVAWMNSPGHRANILNSQYHDLGVAEVAGPQGPLWVMELGGC